MESRLRFYLTQPLTWVMALVLLTYLILIFMYIGRYEMNLSSLINIGNKDGFYSPQKIDPGYLVYQGYGYDGQYNYYIVKDFSLKGGFPNTFRYQRIFYPALIYVFSLGQGIFIPFVFVFINLLSIWIGMSCLIKLMGTSTDLNLFLLALYGLNIGFLVAVLYDLGTPLAVALLVFAVYYYQKDKLYFCTLCLALSLLTMENAWLVITPLILWTIWKKEFPKTKVLLFSILPWIFWQLILGWKFGWDKTPVIASAGFLTFPFMGILEYLKIKPWQANTPQGILHQLNVLPFILFVLVAVVISGIQLFRERTLYSWLVFFHCVFALSLSYQHIWAHTITSPTRILCGIFPFLFLLYVHSSRKRLLSLLIMGSWLLTIMGLLRFAYLPQHSYFIMMK